MIKQIAMAVCDLCGAMKEAESTFYRNERDYKLPDGWGKSPVNSNVALCPNCKKRFDDILGCVPERSKK